MDSPPWKIATKRRGKTIALRGAPLPTPLVPPLVYGRATLPLSDFEFGANNEPKSIALQEIDDVCLLPAHVVVTQDTSELLHQTFMRSPLHVHGGLRRAGDIDGSPAYKPRHPWKLDIHIKCDRPILWAETDRPTVFGHFLLEVIPRLWAAKEVDAKTVVATSVAMSKGYETLFRALGVDAGRLLNINRPVVARKVLVPDLPMARRKWIHPATWEVFDALRHLAATSDVPTSERIYISRSKVSGRELRNEIEVEAYFASQGFTIVYPEQLPIEAQIKLFANAKLVAGSGGSAMHNALFSPADARILIVCSDGWLVNADMLLSQVPGRLGYVFGTPEDDGKPRTSHRTQAPWSVNIENVRAAAQDHFAI